jgi:arylsulfatase A-like enzyme
MDSSARPNILLVIADDHQAAAIGAHGHPVVRTPTLDGLVAQGVTFSGVHIMGSFMPAVCAPSRACLLTGRNVVNADAHPSLVKGPAYEVALPIDAPTLPQVFGGAGYQTFFTGKWHNDLPALLRSFEAGEAIFQGGMCDHQNVPVRNLREIHDGAPARSAPGFSTEIFCGAADAFLRNRDRRRPFFACVALTSPHDPRTPPAAFRSLYPPQALPLPANFQPEHAFDNGELDIRDEKLAPRPRDPATLREHLAGYYGMISHHDAWIGRLLATLRATGAEENTIVVYTSDHGLALGSHGLLGKQNLYEHSTRVPLIMKGPGLPRGRRCTSLAYAFDLYATLCGLAGLASPDGLDSRSLLPALSPTMRSIREELGSLYMDCQRALTTDRWKLIKYRVAGHERRQLFDLATDPDEIEDRSGHPEFAPLVADLTRRLHSWQRSVRDRWMLPPVETDTSLPAR